MSAKYPLWGRVSAYFLLEVYDVVSLFGIKHHALESLLKLLVGDLGS
jgi:hypothetical protein